MDAWVIEQPGEQDPAGKRTRSSARRTHKKSRNGCQQCKKRRIKCDEIQPTCGQCQDRRIECLYSSPGPAVPAKPPALADAESYSPTQSSSSVSVGDAVSTKPNGSISITCSINPRLVIDAESPKSRILRYLEKVDVPNSSIGYSIYKREHVAEIIDHFMYEQTPWIGSPTCQSIMQEHALGLAVNAPYLLHGVLSFSASHMSYLNPSEKRYEIAAVLHYGLSLKKFAQQLQEHVGTDNADSLFGSCFLQAMLAFVNKQELNSQDADTRRFAWLRSIQPVPIIMRYNNLRERLKTSLWFPVFTEGGAHRPESESPLLSHDSPSSASTSAEALEDLYSDASTGEANPYKDPLQRIVSLLRTPIDTTQVGALMRVVGTLPSGFVDMLDKEEPRAVLLWCYWCALMSQVDQWWTQRPARLECYSLCELLVKRADEQILALMSFPASQCGFVLPSSVTSTAVS